MNPDYTKEELELLSEVLKNLHGMIQEIKNECNNYLIDIKKKEEKQQKTRLDRIERTLQNGSVNLKKEWDKLGNWSQDKLNLKTIEKGPTLTLIHLKNWISGLDVPLKRQNLIAFLDKLKEEPEFLTKRLVFSSPNPVAPLNRIFFQLPLVIEEIYKKVYKKKL